MNNNYINTIVYCKSKLMNGDKIYYIVKSFDDNILKVQRLKNQPDEDIAGAINIQSLCNNRTSVLYYGHGADI